MPLVSEFWKWSRALLELEEGEVDGTTSKSSHTSTGEIWSMGCAVKNDSETESGFSHFCGGGKHSDYNIHPKNHTTVSECVYVRHTLKLNKLKGELALCIVRTGFTSELKCIFRIFCLNKGQNHGAGGIRKTYLLLPLMQPLTSVLISPSNCLNFTFSLQKLGCPLNKKASNQLQSKILGTCTRCLSICVGQTDSYSTMGKTALIIKMLFSFCSVWGQLLKMSHS